MLPPGGGRRLTLPGEQTGPPQSLMGKSVGWRRWVFILFFTTICSARDPFPAEALDTHFRPGSGSLLPLTGGCPAGGGCTVLSAELLETERGQPCSRLMEGQRARKSTRLCGSRNRLVDGQEENRKSTMDRWLRTQEIKTERQKERWQVLGPRV